MPSTFLAPVPFIELKQVESTNNYATGLVHAGMAQHGMAVFAHHQTKGKGQRYKQWHGEPGKNIALSLLLQPAGLDLSRSFVLSMAMAVGTHRFFSKYAGDETKIKWPNDIYWRDRKAGGILIENTIQGSRWKWSVAGVGLNINQTSFTEVATPATSVKQITGEDFEPLILARELYHYLQDAYDELKTSEKNTIDAYKSFMYKSGEAVLLKKGVRTFTGIIKDVSLTGQLVVQTSFEERFDVGEVEWII